MTTIYDESIRDTDGSVSWTNKLTLDGGFPHLVGLLKQLQSADQNKPDQVKAAHDFQELLKPGGKPSLGRMHTFDQQLAQHPELAQEFVRYWNEKPDRLDGLVAVIQGSPDRAGEIVDLNYKQKDFSTTTNAPPSPPPAPAAAKPTKPAGSAPTTPAPTASAPNGGTPPAGAASPIPDPNAPLIPPGVVLKPPGSPEADQGDDIGKTIGMILKALVALLKVFGFTGAAKWIDEKVHSKEFQELAGAFGVKVDLADSHPNTPVNNPLDPKAPGNVELGNNINRTAYLGHLVNDTEAKKTTDMHLKDGTPRGHVGKDPNSGLYLAHITMDDGTVENWQQTYRNVDPKTGATLLGFERVKADGTLYLDPTTNKPQAIVLRPGDVGTAQDMANIDKIVKGESIEDLTKATKEQARDYVEYQKQLAAQRHTDMPQIIAEGTHSYGNATAPILWAELKARGMEPMQVISDAPVGQGTGIKIMAMDGIPHKEGTPVTAQEIALAKPKADAFVAKLVTTDPKDTIQGMPGGNDEYANRVFGAQVLTFETPTTSGSKPANLLQGGDHELKAVSNRLAQGGFSAFTATEGTSTADLLKGAPLSPVEQNLAERGYEVYQRVKRAEAGGTFPDAVPAGTAPIIKKVDAAATTTVPVADLKLPAKPVDQTGDAPEHSQVALKVVPSGADYGSLRRLSLVPAEAGSDDVHVQTPVTNEVATLKDKTASPVVLPYTATQPLTDVAAIKKPPAKVTVSTFSMSGTVG